MLEPWTFNPVGPLNRTNAYWYATICRVAYRPDASAMLEQLGELITDLDVTTWPGEPPFHVTCHQLTFDDDRQLFVFQGTTQFQQYIGAALASTLVFEPLNYDGHVSLFFKNAAEATLADIEPHLSGTYALAGHSLGGAIAGLIATRKTTPTAPVRCWDIGAPRHGDYGHATAAIIPRQRVTNQGDPVPLLPPSTGTLIDATLTLYDPLYVPVPVLYPPFFYRHWGTRLHLWMGGGITLPASDNPVGLDVANYLLGGFAGLTDWIGEHDTPEYCRRLRAGIPLSFPFEDIDPDFPEVPTIDAINRALNEADGIDWRIVGAGGPHRPPVFSFADPCRVAPARYPRPVFLLAALPTVGATVLVAGSHVGWTNASRITAKDGLVCQSAIFTTTNPGTVTSHRLQASVFAWDDLPDTATVLGIEVHMHRRSIHNPGGNIRDLEMRLLQGGVLGGDDKADTVTDWPIDQVFRTVVYGADNDTWGRAWTGSQLKTGFAVSFRAQTTAAALSLVEVDWIEVIAWYRL